MNSLHNFMLKCGTVKSVIIITALSVIISMGITYIFVVNGSVAIRADLTIALLISAIVPMLVAPVVSYILISLVFKIHALEKQTRLLVQYDVLTGLLSRRAFYEQVEDELRKTHRERQKIAVLVADVDSFKSINDTFGHEAGDCALKFIADVISQTIRSNDIAGRTGGDEFVFCLPNVSLDHAKEFGGRLLKNLSSVAFNYENNPIQLRLSIGVYVCEVNRNTDIDGIVKAADQALYRAKSFGKHQVAE